MTSMTSKPGTIDRGHFPIPLNSAWGPYLGNTTAAPAVAGGASSGYQSELMDGALSMMSEQLKTTDNREGYTQGETSPSMESYQTGMVMLQMETILRTVGGIDSDNPVFFEMFSPIPIDWDIARIGLFYDIMTIGAPRQMGPNMSGYVPSFGSAGKTVGTVTFGKALNFESNVLLTKKGRAKMNDAMNKLIASLKFDTQSHMILLLQRSNDPSLAAYFNVNMTVENLMLPLTQSFAKYNIGGPNFQELLITLAKDKLGKFKGKPPTIFLHTSAHSIQRNLRYSGNNYNESGPQGRESVTSELNIKVLNAGVVPHEISLWTDVDHSQHVLTQHLHIPDFVFQKKIHTHMKSIGMYFPDTDSMEHFNGSDLSEGIFKLFGKAPAEPGFAGLENFAQNIKGMGRDDARADEMTGLYAKKNAAGTGITSVEHIIDIEEKHLPSADIVSGIRTTVKQFGKESLLSTSLEKKYKTTGLTAPAKKEVASAIITSLLNCLLYNTNEKGTNVLDTDSGATSFNTRLSTVLSRKGAFSLRTTSSADTEIIKFLKFATQDAVNAYLNDTWSSLPWSNIKNVDSASKEIAHQIIHGLAILYGAKSSMTADTYVNSCVFQALEIVFAKKTDPAEREKVNAVLVEIAKNAHSVSVNSYILDQIAKDFDISLLPATESRVHVKKILPVLFIAAFGTIIDGTSEKTVARSIASSSGFWHFSEVAGSCVEETEILSHLKEVCVVAKGDPTEHGVKLRLRAAQLHKLAISGAELMMIGMYLGTEISQTGFATLYTLQCPWPYRVGMFQIGNICTGDGNIITSKGIGRLGFAGIDIQEGKDMVSSTQINKVQMKIAAMVYDENCVIKCPLSAVTDYHEKIQPAFFDNAEDNMKFDPTDITGKEASVLPFLLGWKERDPSNWLTPQGSFWCSDAFVPEHQVDDNKKQQLIFSSVILTNFTKVFASLRGFLTNMDQRIDFTDTSLIYESQMPLACREASVDIISHGGKFTEENKDGWFPGHWKAGSYGLRTSKKGNDNHTNVIRISN